ncbi:Hypothetical predicted protein [Paramuricea clavata]|uniref:Uncharacterized protein n=1 Tax=Paramuricea clavata TaxID=317549 RepID=A0A7D9JDL6_PARCT|nr:Hypothetical predicted protein [Paramuricea clavata]
MGIPDNCENTGKCIADVGKRQQHWKIKELKTQVERTLFANTYGLHLESLKLSDTLVLDMNWNLQKDTFSVGEAAYHELSMIPAGQTLPRLYLVKHCKDSLNQLCHIERTPGKNEGAQVNFYDALRNPIQNHFVLILMGMKGAVSDYACIWCKIHKMLWHDMTKPQDFYWTIDIKRTLEDIRQCCLKKQFSCDCPPLLNIPLENVVLDELIQTPNKTSKWEP